MTNILTNNTKIEEIFHSFDKDKDGKLNLEELLEVIRILNIPHSLDCVTSFLRSHKYLYSSSSLSSPSSSGSTTGLSQGSYHTYPIEVLYLFINTQEHRFQEAYHELSTNYPLRTTDIERFALRIGIHLSREEVFLFRSHLNSIQEQRSLLSTSTSSSPSNTSASTSSSSSPSNTNSNTINTTTYLTIEDIRNLFIHRSQAEGTFQTWLRTTVGPSSLALPDEPSNETPTWILLLSGALAGILSRSFTAPFDRIKTILQASTIPPVSSSTYTLPSINTSTVSFSTTPSSTSIPNYSMIKYFPNKFSMNFTTTMPLLDIPNSRMYSATSSSIFPYSLPSSTAISNTSATASRTVRQVVRNIYTEGGLLSFWRGNGMNVLKVAPETAARMFVYERMKSIVAEDPDEPTLFERFTAGATAGVVAQTVIYPAELIKTRLALSSPGQYKSIAHCARTIVHQEGPRALYRGMLASIIGIIPYAGTDLTVYTFLKESWEERNPNKEPSVFTLLQCGAMATISGQIISYPLQLIRTRLQAQGMVNNNSIYRINNIASSTTTNSMKYTGIWNCLTQTVKNEGIRGLYRGITVNMMKSVPAMAISYATFEITKRGLSDWIR